MTFRQQQKREIRERPCGRESALAHTRASASTISELAAFAQETSSTFFMSYGDRLVATDLEACFGKEYPKAAKREKMIKGLSAKVGEPWIAYCSAEEIVDLLSVDSQ